MGGAKALVQLLRESLLRIHDLEAISALQHISLLDAKVSIQSAIDAISTDSDYANHILNAAMSLGRLRCVAELLNHLGILSDKLTARIRITINDIISLLAEAMRIALAPQPAARRQTGGGGR